VLWPVLGYLKFSAKGTKREIFGMPIPGRLITTNIRVAPYYQEYQENVAKHRGFLAGETRKVPAEEPQVAEEDADFQKAVKESMKDAYALPKGPLPPVVIKEPESG
nr:histone deacetylase 14 [Tanacetum cinerariifolium]